MSNNKEVSQDIVSCLETCTNDLKDLSIQMASLYDTIKIVEKTKEREQLFYAYKQAFDALGNHVKSFNGLIRVVRKQVNDANGPQEQE